MSNEPELKPWLEWADRHGMTNLSSTELRAAYEDAQSDRPSPAAEPVAWKYTLRTTEGYAYEPSLSLERWKSGHDHEEAPLYTRPVPPPLSEEALGALARVDGAAAHLMPAGMQLLHRDAAILARALRALYPEAVAAYLGKQDCEAEWGKIGLGL